MELAITDGLPTWNVHVLSNPRYSGKDSMWWSKGWQSSLLINNNIVSMYIRISVKYVRTNSAPRGYVLFKYYFNIQIDLRQFQ